MFKLLTERPGGQLPKILLEVAGELFAPGNRGAVSTDISRRTPEEDSALWSWRVAPWAATKNRGKFRVYKLNLGNRI